MCRQLNADAALLSVIDTGFIMTAGAVSPQEIVEITRQEFRESHHLLINKLAGNKQVLSFIEEGKPSEVILEAADNWQADLIVMGTHGRTGISHLLMGSVAEKVIRYSKKQVLIIPAR
jgi:nucleotide-binding universal stress UspA family protein